jgi:PKD repeat protein
MRESQKKEGGMSGTQPLAGRVQRPRTAGFVKPTVRAFLWTVLVLVGVAFVLQSVPAMAQLTVNASAAPMSGTAPLTVNFTSTVTGGTLPYTWAWDFGDGGAGTTQNPQYVYGAPGSYMVNLLVVDANGLTGVDTVGPIVVSLPVQINANQTCGEAYLNVCFSATPGGTPPYSYTWDFGDGTFPTPNVNDPLPCHTFTTPNTYYLVTCHVVDADGNTGVGSIEITTTPLTVTPCVTPTNGPAPLLVQFNSGCGMVSGGMPGYSYVWDFGDGSALCYDWATQHGYNDPGTYHVTLTVTDSCEPPTVVTDTHLVIKVVPGALAGTATVDKLCGPSGTTACFAGTAIGGTPPYTYSWNYGDGSPVQTGQAPCHIYAAAGNYTVAMTVTDAAAHTSVDSHIIVSITDPLSVVTSVSRTNGYAPFTAYFTSSVTGGTSPFTYLWDFGDGTTDTVVNPVHIFQPGYYTVKLTVTDGCTPAATASNDSIKIVVYPVNVTAAANLPCGVAPLNVIFTGDAVGGKPPFTWAWDFGDGGTSVQQNPSHSYLAVGNYTAHVTATDSLGVSGTTSVDVKVLTALNVTVQGLPATVGPAPLTVDVSGIATGGLPPYTYDWDFADGSQHSLSPADQHTWATAGLYNVVLTVSDSCGQTKTATLPVNAYGPVTPAPKVNFACGYAPLNVIFTGDATGGVPPYTYAWTFGDGGTDTLPNPSHSYLTVGTHTATLTVTDSLGHTGVGTVDVTVTPELTVAVQGLPGTAGPAPLTVNVSSTVSGGTPPYTYDWNFQDGSPNSNSPSDQHTWIAGEYDVTLTVSDSCGHQVVANLPISSYGPITVTPAADFTCGYAPLNVAFTGDVVGGVPPLTYAWSFGDGGTSTLANPAHSYLSIGAFTATLTVTDHVGRIGVGSVTVTTTAKMIVAVTGLPQTTGPAPLTVNFASAVAGGTPPYTYSWEFGDGTNPVPASAAQHTFIATGTYDVVLTVDDSCGHTGTGTLTINAYAPVVPSLGASATCGTAPLNVCFDPTATGGVPPYIYSWSFGDGSPVSHDQKPCHNFLSAGDFTVILTATDSLGNVGSANAVIHAVASLNLQAFASADVTSGLMPLLVNFSSSVSGSPGPFTYSWDFGDGSAADTGSHPNHLYQTAGTYAVSLVVTAADACGKVYTVTDSHLQINVLQAPSIEMTSPSSGATYGAAVTFQSTVYDNVPVLRVVYYANGVPIGVATTSPYTFVWDSTGYNGSVSVYAMVVDSLGRTAQTSAITIYLNNPTVSSAQIATAPLRIKVFGTGFAPGAIVLINGHSAPLSEFRSTTMMMAKGDALLKAMLPKGVPVTVQVLTPSGGLSNGATVVR